MDPLGLILDEELAEIAPFVDESSKHINDIGRFGAFLIGVGISIIKPMTDLKMLGTSVALEVLTVFNPFNIGNIEYNNYTENVDKAIEIIESSLQHQDSYYWGRMIGDLITIRIGTFGVVKGISIIVFGLGGGTAGGAVEVSSGVAVLTLGATLSLAGAVIATGATVTAAGGALVYQGGGSFFKHANEFFDKLFCEDAGIDAVGDAASNWTKGIKATQEVIPGTNVPKSFVMEGKYVNGKEVWVHDNATKHMGEFVNSAKGSVLVENELMASFNNTVSKILPKVKSGTNFFNLNGWEIGINGDTGVTYHALYTGR